VFAEGAAAWSVRGRRPGSLPQGDHGSAAAGAPRGARAGTAAPGDQRRGSGAHLRSRLYGREPSDACPTRRADRT